MPMKLVRKKNPRGGPFRWLTRDEESAVKNISGLRDFTDRTQYTLNNKVLREMRQLGAWLQCDCIPGDSPAMNSANLYRDTGTPGRRSNPTNTPIEDCPSSALSY